MSSCQKKSARRSLGSDASLSTPPGYGRCKQKSYWKELHGQTRVIEARLLVSTCAITLVLGASYQVNDLVSVGSVHRCYLKINPHYGSAIAYF